MGINHFEPRVLLPWLNYFTHANGDPASQMWSFQRRKGGSGEYAWRSADKDTVSVEVGGVVRGLKLGSTEVTMRDALNPHNKDTIAVEVSPIGSLGWLEAKLEVLRGAHDHLTLIARDSRQRLFTNCTSVFVEWKPVNEKDLELKDDSVINLLDEDYELSDMREMPTMYAEVSSFVERERESLL